MRNRRHQRRRKSVHLGPPLTTETFGSPNNQETGVVIGVDVEDLGSRLAVATVGGETQITVYSTADFDDQGGSIVIGADPFVSYRTYDPDTGIVTLSPGQTVAGAHDVDTTVYLYPIGTEYFAWVALDAGGDEPIIARIPHAYVPMLTGGTRQSGTEETVQLEYDEGGYEWTVTDVLGKIPTADVQFGYLRDPETTDTTGDFNPTFPGFTRLQVGELVSDSIPNTDLVDRILYVDGDMGDDSNDGLIPTLGTDTFNRTTANGWGTSDSGHVWAKLAGTTANFSTSPGFAQYVAGASDAGLMDMQGTGGWYDEVMFKVRADKTPGTASLFLGALFRIIDANNYVTCQLVIPPGGGTLNTRIHKFVAGSGTVIGAQTPVAQGQSNWAIGADFWIKAQVIGLATGDDKARGQPPQIQIPLGLAASPFFFTLRVKVWKDGDPEPAGWDQVIQDNDAEIAQYAGRIGVQVATTAISNPNITVQVRSFGQSVLDAQNTDASDFTTTATSAYITNDGTHGPFATLQAAINSIGQLAEATVGIVCRGHLPTNGGMAEDIVIAGRIGFGQLNIDGQGAAGTVSSSVVSPATLQLVGSVQVDGCAINVHLQHLQITDSGGGWYNSTINVNQAKWVYCDEITVNADATNTGKITGIQYQFGSFGRVSSCQVDGGAIHVLRAQWASTLTIDACKGGSGSLDGVVSTASIVMLSGTSPAGGTTTTDGGQIFGAYSSSSGSAGGGTGRKTKNYRAVKSKSWQGQPTNYGWRDGDNVYEGNYGYGNHKGVWQIPAAVASDLAGKTVDSMYITIRRLSAGGSSAGQAINLFTTTSTPGSGGEPAVTSGPVNVGSLAWGQTKKFRIPNALVADIKAGKNVGIFSGADGFPYVICAGVSEYGLSGQITVTFH